MRLHPADFYRKLESPELFARRKRGCIDFVIDKLLYVGATRLTATKRWTRTPYRKQYIPPDKKVLLAWERELIIKWRFSSGDATRTPFNKENWNKWGQPFGSS